MKKYYLKGYVPKDGEHIIVDEEEYVAHEVKREQEENGFWERLCSGCAFNNNGVGVHLCPVFDSKELACALYMKRYVRFEKVKGKSA